MKKLLVILALLFCTTAQAGEVDMTDPTVIEGRANYFRNMAAFRQYDNLHEAGKENILQQGACVLAQLSKGEISVIQSYIEMYKGETSKTISQKSSREYMNEADAKVRAIVDSSGCTTTGTRDMVVYLVKAHLGKDIKES